MNVLAIDFGEKRLGFALGDTAIKTAVPLPIYTSRSMKETIAHIRSLIDEFRIKKIVIGQPVHMNGSQSVGSRRARAFAKRIETSTGLPVILIDERLTSRDADERLKDITRDPVERRKKLDSVAAAIILEEFLEQQ